MYLILVSMMPLNINYLIMQLGITLNLSIPKAIGINLEGGQ